LDSLKRRNMPYREGMIRAMEHLERYFAAIAANPQDAKYRTLLRFDAATFGLWFGLTRGTAHCGHAYV
jgi:hypothetical protein